MIKMVDAKNKFCPFIFCDICEDKIINPNDGTAAFVPQIGGCAEVIHVHNCINRKNCLDEADHKYGLLYTQCLDHHFHMLLHNAKIDFPKDRLDDFAFMESM